MKEKLPCRNERQYAVALTCMKEEAKKEGPGKKEGHRMELFIKQSVDDDPLTREEAVH